jgi:hypothetical protein
MKYLRKFNENFNVDKDVHIEIIAGDIIDYLKKNCVDRWGDIFKRTEVKNEVNDIINHYVEDLSDLNIIKFWVCLELNDLEELKEMLPSLEKDEEYEKCQLIKNKLDNETLKSI